MRPSFILGALLVLLFAIHGRAQTSSTFECKTHLTTDQHEDGGDGSYKGSLIFLDRHDINCKEHGVLRRYQLKRNLQSSPNKIYYEYECCKGPWLTTVNVSKSTGWTVDAYNIQTIDRANPNCQEMLKAEYPNTNWALNRVVLQRGNNHGSYGHNWRWHVNCVQVDLQSTPQASCALTRAGFSRQFNRHNDVGVIYLDELNFNCPNKDSVLLGTRIDSLGSYSMYFAGYVTCCDVKTQVPNSDFDDKFVQIKSYRLKQCLTYNDNTKKAEVRPCTSSSDTLYNTFYVEPANVYRQHILKLRPYRTGEPDALGVYLQVSKEGQVYFDTNSIKVSETAVEYTKDGIIYNPHIKSYVVASKSGDVVAQKKVEAGFESLWKFEEKAPPTKHVNLGKVCSKENLGTHMWNQGGCPYRPVIGFGGPTAVPKAQLTVPEDASKMMFVQSVRFYIRDKGTSDASIARIMFTYSPDPEDKYNPTPTEWTVGASDSSKLDHQDCGLLPNEYITELRIVPQTSGPVSSRSIAGVWWKTSSGHTCTVPSNLNLQGSELLNREQEIGSGFVYGGVAGLDSEEKNLGVLGFVFYDSVTEILSKPTWDLNAARQSLVLKPTVSKVVECNAKDSSSALKCVAKDELEKKISRTVSNGYEMTNTYAYEYNKRFAFKQSALFRFQVGIPVIKIGKESEYVVETEQEWTINKKWEQSFANEWGTTYTVEETKKEGCEIELEAQPGKEHRASLDMVNGVINVEYNGNMTYLLKSGAKFSFPLSGKFESTAFARCTGKIVDVIDPSPSPEPAPIPSPKPISPKPDPKPPAPKPKPPPSPSASPPPPSPMPPPSPLASPPPPSPTRVATPPVA